MRIVFTIAVLLMAYGCATRGEVRDLKTRMTRSFNFVDSQIAANEGRIGFVAREMDKFHPEPKKVYPFTEAGVKAAIETNRELLDSPLASDAVKLQLALSLIRSELQLLKMVLNRGAKK